MRSMDLCSTVDTYSFLSGKKPQALVQWGAGFTGGFADLLQLLNDCHRQSCKDIKKHCGFRNTDLHMRSRLIKCSRFKLTFHQVILFHHGQEDQQLSLQSLMAQLGSLPHKRGTRQEKDYDCKQKYGSTLPLPVVRVKKGSQN